MNPAVLSGQTSLTVTFLASFLIWFMFLGLTILWLIDGRIKKEQAFHAFLSALIAWGIASMIKNLFPTPRPFETLGLTPLTITIPSDGGFPSEHAATAWALGLTVWMHDKKYGLLFILGAIGVSMGRVLSNVHFPADIIVGSSIGIAVSYLFEKLHLYRVLTGRKNRG